MTGHRRRPRRRWRDLSSSTRAELAILIVWLGLAVYVLVYRSG